MSGKRWQGEIVGFDLIVAADGPKSAVRAVFFANSTLESKHHQKSLIVDYDVCPKKKPGTSSLLQNVSGALFAFRRFFGRDHCSMQILLTEDSLVDPNVMVEKVSSAVLETVVPPSRIREIDFRPKLARWTTALIAPSTVAALVGDSVVNAHYRLGIGVNTALSSMDNLEVLVKRMLQEPDAWRTIVEEKNKVDQVRFRKVKSKGKRADASFSKKKKQNKIFEFQEQVIKLEARCGLVLSFAPPTRLDDREDDLNFFDDAAVVSPLFSSRVFLPEMIAYTKNNTKVRDVASLACQ